MLPIGGSLLLAGCNSSSDDDDDAVPAKPQPQPQPALASTFALAVLPDTQFYSRYATDAENQQFMRKYGSEPFQAQTRWVAQHAAALNIPFLAHLGDVVDQQGKPDQWKVASAAMKVLEDAKVPYSILAGNHDVIMDRDYVDEQPEEREGNRRAAGPGARTLSEELRPRPREAAGHVRRPRCQRLPLPCVRSRGAEVHGAVAVVARVGRGAGMGQPGHPRQSTLPSSWSITSC